MAHSIKLSEIKTGQHKAPIRVKILALWFPNPNPLAKSCQMIISDDYGERMEVEIPHPYYLKRFEKVLKEGDWYVLKDFWVWPKTEEMQNTSNTKVLKFTYKTSARDDAPIVDSALFKFVEIPNIIDGCHDDTTHPIDTYGIIIKVSKTKPLPWVPRQAEVMIPKKFRNFYIVEMDGSIIKCCAIGETYEKFNKLWDGGYHDIKVKESCVFCVLHFWNISEFKGQRSLLNNDECSRILFDPTLPELEHEDNIGRFSWVFYKKNVPESDDEYEDTW